jgi:hypothetical protein
VGHLDGHCGVRVRGPGRTGLSATFCQTATDGRKSAGMAVGPERGHTLRMSQVPPQTPDGGPPPPGGQPPYGGTPPPGGQPPYGGLPPYGGRPTYPAPPRRQRPRVVWFVVGGILLVLAPVIFVGAIFTVLRPLTQEDAVFAADGQAHQVSVDSGEERALFKESGSAVQCVATNGSGTDVEFRRVSGSFTYNEWKAVARFDTGDGDLTFTCNSGSGSDRVRIAQLPSTGGFIAGILIGVIVPLLLGLVGIVMLIITGILWATGAPRVKKA